MGCVIWGAIYGARPRKVPFEAVSHIGNANHALYFEFERFQLIADHNWKRVQRQHICTHDTKSIRIKHVSRFYTLKPHDPHDAFINKSQVRPLHHLRPRRRWQYSPPLDNPQRLENPQELIILIPTCDPLCQPGQLLRRLERQI